MLSKLRRILFTIRFYFVFILISHLYYFFGLISCRNNDHLAWKRIGKKSLEKIFYFSGIHIDVKGAQYVKNINTVILCANHQSYLDGLVIYVALGIPFTAITLPFELVPKIMAKWFVKMGYFSISRDIFEDLKYSGSIHTPREEIVSAGVEALKRGESLLIFPEGRREFAHRLLPFHKGVAELAIRSKTPVVPIVLEGLDNLFPPTSKLLTPTNLTVTVKPPVKLWEISKDPLVDARALEEHYHHYLPARYFTHESIPHHLHGNRGAFFDLDGTLASKNIYTLILTHYLKKNFSISKAKEGIKLGIKKFLVSNGIMFRSAVRLLKDIPNEPFVAGVSDVLEKERDQIFFIEMLQLLELHRLRGNLLFIITEEPQEIMRPVYEFLKVPGFGTEVEIKEGKFTGKIIGKMMKNETKALMLERLAHEHKIDLSKSYAYGNSWQDYEMLRSVGHATLVQPKQDLKERGKKLGFRIIENP